jgi:hypothetical protein
MDVYFGATAAPLREQLGEWVSPVRQMQADAITTLAIGQMISLAEKQRAHRRLIRALRNDEKIARARAREHEETR